MKMKSLLMTCVLTAFAVIAGPAMADPVKCTLWVDSYDQLILDFPGARISVAMRNMDDVQRVTEIAKNLAQAGVCEF